MVEKDVLQRRVNHDRHLFARWLRDKMKADGIQFRELRDTIGLPSTKFNKMLRDEFLLGMPYIPTDAECKVIADFLEVRERFVINLAKRARAALEDVVYVDPREEEYDDSDVIVVSADD